MKRKQLTIFVTLLCVASSTFAQHQISTESTDKKVPQEHAQLQDMSDPLAVYTQAGVGFSDKGLNIRIGRTYNTGNSDTMGMNLIEVNGIAGEYTGWSNSSERDNSIDSVRFRNFNVNTKNGRGTQIDLNYNVELEQLDASYSLMQALPKLGPLQLFPLAGVGVRVQNGKFDGSIDTGSGATHIDTSIGYTIPGVYGVVGLYSQIKITDKFWINYNPMWQAAIAGSDNFTKQGFAGDSNVFTNELGISYQFTPRFNVRYWANWTHDQSYFDGDQRIEFNYQF